MRCNPRISAAVPSCADEVQSSSSTPTYRKNNSNAARGSRAAGGVSLEVVENVTEAGLQRQREVGEGNRFADPRGTIPRGLGRKE